MESAYWKAQMVLFRRGMETGWGFLRIKDFVSKESLISNNICFYTFSHIKQELFTCYRQVKSYKDGLHKERVHILLSFIKINLSIVLVLRLFCFILNINVRLKCGYTG